MVLISVIVPLFNKGAYLDRALDSIAAQTHTELEVVIVDDGSTDDGPDRVRRRSDPRIRLVSQGNAGPGAARNRGLTEIRGALVAFLDADDAWAPEYLASAAREFERLGEDVVAVTSGYVDWPEGVSREPLWRRRGLADGVHRVHPDTSAARFIALVAYMTPCTTVARTDVLRRWGGFYDRAGARYAEDAVLWLKLLLNHPVYFSMTPLMHFHREASALSSNYAGARPVESFLLDPQSVEAACPPDLQPALHRFYAARACKTACILSLWGDLARARQLTGRFVTVRDWTVPYFVPAQIAATRAGHLALRALLRAQTAVFRSNPLARSRAGLRPPSTP
jgi:glycosyltransferase involved in cell wall biosynthesis